MNKNLYYASMEGDLSNVKFLIKKGADNFSEALNAAAFNGELEIVEYLTVLNVITDLTDYRKAAYSAIQGDRLYILVFLLKNITYLNTYDNLRDILKYAVLYSKCDILDWILANYYNYTYVIHILNEAVIHNNMDVIKHMLEKWNIRNMGAIGIIFTASKMGNLKIVKYLLSQGFDIDVSARCSILHKKYNILDFLIDELRYKIPKYYLEQIGMSRDLELINYVIEKYGRLTDILNGAVYSGRLDTIKYLIEEYNFSDIEEARDIASVRKNYEISYYFTSISI